MDKMKDKMKIITVALGALQTNCYLLVNDRTNEAVVIDPADDFPLLKSNIKALGVKPVVILLTHGHFDHITAANEARNTYGIKIYACSAEKALLEDPRYNGSALMTTDMTLTVADWVEDGDALSFAGFDISVIGTPGHTAGGVCYYCKADGALISGDTIFRGSIGRTDFPTGSADMISHSIKVKLFALPDETVIYPGHGPTSTIGYEKKHNVIIHMP